jgi:hypothetical protein
MADATFSATLTRANSTDAITGKMRASYECTILQNGQPFYHFFQEYFGLSQQAVTVMNNLMVEAMILPMRAKGYTVNQDATGGASFPSLDRTGEIYLQDLGVRWLHILANYGAQQAQAKGQLAHRHSLPLGLEGGPHDPVPPKSVPTKKE